ncbi:hypothetical protein JY651_13085 [Pyxidicoccus parkwayensis]|uniref:Carboxypeptidase regulatory-like domain-containing protein n=1 Tax=Pyxidicoccus parkwayensis TaxID=2813578 RepID=A0ABX7P5U9_9BACT|nr:hypothetical protein [Pyxidicoccus parkwaysis]QSQ25800.1 hypothetical protein JY651_13085 [Pyxidicoccus parkwaysis]
MSTDECASGKKWTGGDSESPLMHPGGDCIQCHTERKGPSFVAAGTVYAGDAHAANDCAGVEGAEVVLTDAKQKSYTLKTNAAGNFYLRTGDAQGFTFPYTARVTYNSTQIAMTTQQSTGACGSCHTVQGTTGAPGRINVE